MDAPNLPPLRLCFIALGAAGAKGPLPWLYLGKDAFRRLKLEKIRGRPAASLGSLLHEEAGPLRQPFLDLVADLGSRQKDVPAWWAGTLAWKNWAASDAFLLACYQSLCVRLAGQQQPLGFPSLAVVIEDPWLFHQLRHELAARPQVAFEGAPSLALERLRAVLRGLTRRARWALRMLWSRLRLIWHGGLKPRLPQRGVLLYSYLLESSLAKPETWRGGSPDVPAIDGAKGQPAWHDPYLPGLEEEIKTAGIPVVRCTYADVTGFESRLAATEGRVVSLLAFAGLGDFFRALAAWPPRPQEARLKDLTLDLILRREWWQDLSRAGRSAYYLHLHAARRLLSAASWQSVVMPWEGQPPERLLALAARESGVRCIGCQHSTVSRFQLPYFLGRGEAGTAPMPDIILVSGPRALKLLSEGGIPRERLRLAGNRRFTKLRSQLGERQAKIPNSNEVLVILPVDRWHGRQLLAAISRGSSQEGRDLDLVVKPHPANPLSPAEIPFKAVTETGALGPCLERCGLVVFGATAAGLEAWAQGRPVLRYRADSVLDIDPVELLDDAVLPTAGDADLTRKLADLIQRPPAIPRERLAWALDELFSPVDPTIWHEAIYSRVRT